MSNLITRISRKVLGSEGRRVPPGTVDHAAFVSRIAYERRRGAKIGHKVRLLGIIDGINPHLVSIGDYSVLGLNAVLITHGPTGGPKSVTVEDFVYIGYGAIILPGVCVGRFSIVGAGAVVSRDVAPGSIVAGNPARLVRQATEAEKHDLENSMLNDLLFGWDPGSLTA